MSPRRANLLAAFTGALFAVGLALGGMLDTRRIVGFLDVTGAWDPHLMLVMAGAILVFMPVYRIVRARELSAGMAQVYHLGALPLRDPRLVLGSALFGVGWALVGYCPGPAVVSLGAELAGVGAGKSAGFALAMLLGMGAHRVYAAKAAPAPERATLVVDRPTLGPDHVGVSPDLSERTPAFEAPDGAPAELASIDG